MIPLWQALLLLQQEGFSDIVFFPATNPTLLLVKNLGAISVTDNRVALSSVRAQPVSNSASMKPAAPIQRSE